MSIADSTHMRVLWFVNKPLPAVCERLGLPPIHRGGWLDALEGALRETGVELAIACDAPAAMPPFSVRGTSYYVVPRPNTGRRSRAVRALEARAYATPNLSDYDTVVEDFRPDVVHIHGTEGPFGLRIPHWKAPTVVSLQGVLSSYAELDSRGRDRDAWLSMSPTLFAKGAGMAHETQRLRRLARRERRIVANCDFFIGRTRFDHDFILSVKPSSSYFHCDELLRPAFLSTPPWHPPLTAPRTIACSGGDYARKGLGTAVEALALLRTNGGLDVALRVLGTVRGGESAEALLRHVRRLGLVEYVQLTGALDAAQTAQHLASADAFVLPTHADNSPNSLCEAMAVGVPVVASAAGGIPSMAANDLEALLVQDGDPYALAGALYRTLSDDDLAVSLSQRARSRAHFRHDPQRIVEQILTAYSAVAARHPMQTAPWGPEP